MSIGRGSGLEPKRAALQPGVELFANEEGSTSLAAAVAVLVSLVLVFSMANVQWVSSRAADVQAVADASALAGMNVVAAYVSIAQVLDAVVLSLGLVGMLTLAIGLVLSAIPFINAAGPPVLEAAAMVLETRAGFARTAAQGLQIIEEAVPYLVAANALVTARANRVDGGSYVGVAIPYPLEGSSDFGLLTADDVAGKATEAMEWGDEIESLAQQAEEARKEADEALERGWRADCGDDPSMRERAEALVGLAGALNPEYPTSTGWDFGVAILRARAYYQQRFAYEVPADATPAEATRSAARKAFYGYALEQVTLSSYVENPDGTVTCSLAELPANTSEVRLTELYTDPAWPCTGEAAGATIHSYAGCPGAVGPSMGYASVADQEAGRCVECSYCQFTVVDLGRAPAATSSIETGFEYHWGLVVQASEDYEAARFEQVQQELAANEASDAATRLFEQALESLTAVRVELSPPGRYGCVSVAADPVTRYAPEDLVVLVGNGAMLPPRVAVSAAVLAGDHATEGGNILAGFFDGLVAQGGIVGGVSSVLDAVVSAWGESLVSYGNGYQALMGTMDIAFTALSDLGLGGVSAWLRTAIKSAADLTALEPADMSAKKPVLVNSADVMYRAGNDWYAAVRALAITFQTVDFAAGPTALLQAAGVFVDALTGSKIVVARIEVPGTQRSIPIEIDFGWLDGLEGAA